jgi:ATP-dependent Clp protease protease subunit
VNEGGDRVEPVDLAYRRLLDRRTAFLRGPLDDEAANRLAAELMTLDAESAEALTLLVNSPGGPLAAAFPVIDTIDLLRAPVATTAIGEAAGTAAAVVACGARGQRRAGPTSRFNLRLAPEALEGSAGLVLDRARELTALRERLAERLGLATGRPVDALVEDFERGRFLGPSEAVELGLVDEVTPPTRSR